MPFSVAARDLSRLDESLVRGASVCGPCKKPPDSDMEVTIAGGAGLTERSFSFGDACTCCMWLGETCDECCLCVGEAFGDGQAVAADIAGEVV